MKVLIISAVVFGMAYLPVWALESLVMPQVEMMQYSYAHAGETAEALFPQR